MSTRFYVYKTQWEPTCWSCGHWIIGGGCYKDADNVRPTEHDFHCDDWVKEGAEGTITGEMEVQRE